MKGEREGDEKNQMRHVRSQIATIAVRQKQGPASCTSPTLATLVSDLVAILKLSAQTRFG